MAETSKETPTNIAETSETLQENPTSIAETSKAGPGTIDERPRHNQARLFSFGMKPAKTLKMAIEALSDSDFNPQGLARIDVDRICFQITVQNTVSHVTGHLELHRTGLIDLKCAEPVYGKMVNLVQFSVDLVDVDDEDTIAIHLLDGSTELVLIFGSPPSQAFTVRLLETGPQYDRFPTIIYFCESEVLSMYLRLIIQCCQQEEQPQQVGMYLTNRDACFTIRGKDESLLKIKAGRTTGLKDKQLHVSYFKCCHGVSLVEASLLVPVFSVLFLSYPRNHMMLRFKLPELGDLVYIMETTMMFKNVPN